MGRSGHGETTRRWAAAAAAALVFLGSQAIAGEATRLAVFGPEEEPTYLCPWFGAPIVVGDSVYWTTATELVAADVAGGRVAVVRDTRTGGQYGGLSTPVAAGSRLFFLADDGTLGSELWTSDGTSAGTTLVRELRTGGSSSDISYLTAFQERVFFSGPLNVAPYQTLWSSDGTDAGTSQVTAIRRPGPMLALASQLVVASLSSAGSYSTLWRTDGTTGGTVQLATLAPDGVVHALAPFKTGALIWVRRGSEYAQKRELWRTDLTAKGTVKVAEVDPPLTDRAGGQGWFVEMAGSCYFMAKLPEGPLTLWRTDGTAAETRLLATVDNADASMLSPPYLATSGGLVYFAGADQEHGLELWQSDGTAGGTHLALDIAPGRSGASPQWLTAAGDTVYFAAGDPYIGRELWATGGERAGAAPVVDLCPGPYGSLPPPPQSGSQLPPGQIAAVADRVVFFGSSGAAGCRLWVSDGSESGTRPVEDTLPTPPTWPQGQTIAAPAQIAVNGSVLLLAGSPYRPAGTFRTDGTAASFAPIDDPAMPGLFGANVWPRLHGQLLVNGSTEVLRSDGTAAGTVPAFPGTMLSSSNAEAGVFYFWRDGDVIWASDGTEAGTRPVRTFRPRPRPYELPRIALSHGIAFFYADDGTHGVEPWRTDGTDAGTAMISDLCPGICSTTFLSVFATGGRAYYADDRGGCLLTDGTPAGSQYVLGGCGPNVARFADMILYRSGGALVRARPDLTDVRTLHSFESFSLIQSTASGAPLRLPLLFRADDGTHGDELWRTDGTPEGTLLVADLNPGPLPSMPGFLLQALGRTFFTATSPETGAELWSSDGTSEGTRLEADLEPGPGSAIPRGYSLAGNSVVFQVARFGGAFEEWAVRVSPLPRLDVPSCTAGEGRLGDGFAHVRVYLSEPAVSDVRVSYRTEEGSAEAGTDFLPVAGRLVLPAGTLGPVTILVPIVDDPMVEAPEECFLVLEEPEGAVLGHASATLTILDDGYGRPYPRTRLHRGDR